MLKKAKIEAGLKMTTSQDKPQTTENQVVSNEPTQNELLKALSSFNVSVKQKSSNIKVNAFRPTLIQYARYYIVKEPLTFQELKLKLVEHFKQVKVKSGKTLIETFQGALITVLNAFFLSLDACQCNKGERGIYKGCELILIGTKNELQNGIQVLTEIRQVVKIGEKYADEVKQVETYINNLKTQSNESN